MTQLIAATLIMVSFL